MTGSVELHYAVRSSVVGCPAQVFCSPRVPEAFWGAFGQVVDVVEPRDGGSLRYAVQLRGVAGAVAGVANLRLRAGDLLLGRRQEVWE